MRRKGISPLIAAVLLIAFTMAVASIFAEWVNQPVETAQEGVSQQAGNLTNCNRYRIDITDATGTKATVRQMDGPEGIGNISVSWVYGDGTDSLQDYVNIGGQQGQATAQVSGGSNDWEEVSAVSLNCGSVSSTASYSDFN